MTMAKFVCCLAFDIRNMDAKAVKTKMTEREVQSPGRRGGALLGRGKLHTEPLHHPPVLPQQKRTRGWLYSLLFLVQ